MAYTAVIQLQMDGAEGVKSTMRDLEERMKSVEGRHEIRVMADKAKQEVMALSAELGKLQNELSRIDKKSDSSTWEKKNNELKETKNNARLAATANKVLADSVTKLNKIEKEEASQAKAAAKAEDEKAKARDREAKAAERQAQADERAAKKAEEAAERERRAEEKKAQAIEKTRQREAERYRQEHSFSRYYNSVSSKMAHAGSAMQSIGNALTQMTSPFKQITDGMMMGAGYKLLGQFTEGLSSSFERADVMRKYPRIMESMGYSAEEAQKSIDKLDQSVQGLPTSLVDMVGMAQRFTSTVGDMSKGTDLAIAANNAFLASMSTETQKYQGMMQLQDVIGGKKMNAKEWQALANSMMPAIRMMGESLGYEGKALDEYVAKVQQGKIANEDFIDTLIKAGTDDEGKIRKIAMESLDTWEAFFSRIGTAASKLGYKGIIEPLNELVNTVTSGKFESVNLLLDDFIYNGIDKMKNSVRDWIKAHPEEITDFFKTLGKVDWASILKGWAEGMSTIAQFYGWLAKLGGGKDLSWIGKWGVYLNKLGGFFTIFGGLVKGGRIPMGGIVGGVMTLLGKTRLIGKLKGLFGKKGALKEAGEVAESVPTVADSFKRAFKSLEGLLKAAGAITLVAGTGVVAFESAKLILRNIKEMGDMLSEGDWSNAPIVATGVIAGIGAFIEIFNYIGTALGAKGLLSVAIASAATALVSGTFAADMWLIKKGVQQILDTIRTLDEVASAITNMQGIGTLDDSIKEKFRTTIDAINEIKAMFVGKSGSKMDRGQVEAGLPTFGIGKVTALTNIGSAISQMQNIINQLNALAGLSVSDPSQVIEDLKTAIDKLRGIRASKGLPKQTEAIAASLIQVRRMAYHINKLAGVSVNAGGFADTIAQIKNALGAIKGLNQSVTLDIKVVMGSGFRSSVNGVVKQLKNAKKDIEAYKKPIAFIVPVNVTFSVVTNASAAIAKMKNERERVTNAKNNVKTPMFTSTGGRISRNGVLYRSGGGNIGRSYASVASFRPRGTDKIHTMLTEGEYVQKKQAVDFFGVDFMRKVNNLDVRGAMQSLLTKAGTSVGVGRQSIVNNTVNNNQRVNMTVNTNNPNFAGARMGRFVGAL